MEGTRLHWVMCEALDAATAVFAATGNTAYSDLYEQWWGYSSAFLIDRRGGSWHHELDETNHPVSRVWSGKPDVYHALQAMLLPKRTLASGLAKGTGSTSR
jgi:sulfoquinovose isomerase